jgi:hypothetical protein
LFEDVSDAAGFGPENRAGGFEEAGGAAVGDVVLLRRLVSSVLGARFLLGVLGRLVVLAKVEDGAD